METEYTAPVTAWVAERIYWIFLGLMFLNVLQRKYQKQASRKRMATLRLGIALFFLFVVAQSINHFGGTDVLFYLALVAFVAVVYAYRESMVPFRLKSAVDRRWLNFHEIFFDDEHGDGDKRPEEQKPDDDDS